MTFCKNTFILWNDIFLDKNDYFSQKYDEMHINLPKKRYYKIGEVAKAFGLNTSHIRFWENEFEVLNPKKNAKGNRLFTQEDIRNLKLIYHLVKEKGYTLEGAKVKMKSDGKSLKNKSELIDKLKYVKSELKKIKNQI